jgi:hypothetical protein
MRSSRETRLCGEECFGGLAFFSRFTLFCIDILNRNENFSKFIFISIISLIYARVVTGDRLVYKNLCSVDEGCLLNDTITYLGMNVCLNEAHRHRPPAQTSSIVIDWYHTRVTMRTNFCRWA